MQEKAQPSGMPVGWYSDQGESAVNNGRQPANVAGQAVEEQVQKAAAQKQAGVKATALQAAGPMAIAQECGEQQGKLEGGVVGPVAVMGVLARVYQVQVEQVQVGAIAPISPQGYMRRGEAVA